MVIDADLRRFIHFPCCQLSIAVAITINAVEPVVIARILVLIPGVLSVCPFLLSPCHLWGIELLLPVEMGLKY